jgi:hypothetical protein
MQRTRVQEIAGDRLLARDEFPFEFGGQPGAGPPRVGIRFEETQMAHGRMRVDVDHPVQRERAPRIAIAFPVQRRLPLARDDGVPAKRQPQLGPPVAAVGNEFGEFAVRDRSRRERERGHESAMRRQLVVECKAAVRMAERRKSRLEGMPCQRLRLHRRQRPPSVVDRLSGIAREQVLDVGQDQL